jgi:hypothetical protein|tara:strand:+ start:617 stop:859 length:243 start_codon:yes stop_codon:yes gene_type:complete
MEHRVLNATKRENWRNEIEGRVNRILRALDQISDCAQPNKYEYTMSDVERIESALMSGIDDMKSSYKHSKKTAFTLRDEK